MKNRKLSLYIEDILDAMKKIEFYIENIDEDEFEKNTLVFDAVVRNFEIIGEASKYITTEIRELFKDIPWSNMVALRNVVIHNYLGIDPENIYKIATEDFPETKKDLEQCLDVLKKEEDK